MQLSVQIRPEPWSAGVAHQIMSRARAKAATIEQGKITFKYNGYLVIVSKSLVPVNNGRQAQVTF